jgi:hypothetical protein
MGTKPLMETMPITRHRKASAALDLGLATKTFNIVGRYIVRA